jgi:hypothetical protein
MKSRRPDPLPPVAPARSEPPAAVDWSLGTWEGSRLEQLRRWSRLTLDEIVHAQEEMAELAEWFTRARRPGQRSEPER